MFAFSDAVLQILPIKQKMWCFRPCVLNSPPKKGGDVTFFQIQLERIDDISAKHEGIAMLLVSF